MVKHAPGTLKKISVRNARLGMFIHELCGSWMDHPFWKARFLLDDPRELKRLKSCGIREIWIDTAKGLDAVPSAPTVSLEAEEREVESVLREVVREEQANAGAPCPFHEELERARAVHARARQKVMSMFQDARMGQALQIGGALSVVDDIAQSLSRNTTAFLTLARLKSKDDYTNLHSVAVCAFMTALGIQLGLTGETLRSAGLAGLLHDIGKMTIPDSVLKKTGTLSDEEFALVKTHPRRGWEMLRQAAHVDEIVLDVCLNHHERMDGRGYPGPVPGKELSIFARMVAVCDVYDALTSDRCYRRAWSPAETVRKMAEWLDGHFDQRVFFAFVKVVGIYPTGTLVRLTSGRLGIVTDQTACNLLLPIVKVFFSANANAPIAPELVDLSAAQDAIVSAEDSAQWGFDWTALLGLA
ncbi:MAG: HD-GYP domain-containing protein [Betaproteobacteria bacterium]|nr:HD-GYP domain-containing protein [Betaproteobacteria bacterium]